MAALPSYDNALSRVRKALRSLAAAGLRTPITVELQDVVRTAARSTVLSADLGRLVSGAMRGDPHAVEVGLAIARRAAREYHELTGAGPTGGGV